MKITALETYLLSAPLPRPVRTSTHTIARVSEVVVTLTTDAGLVGVGEAHGPFLFQAGPDGLRKAAVMAELYQVPLAAHHDPQIHVHAVAASPTGFILESFADPTRDPLWFELFRERPAIVGVKLG